MKKKLKQILKEKYRWDRSIKSALRDHIAFGWCDEDKEFTGIALDRVRKVVQRAYREGKDEGAQNAYC